jgi:hypothetical protein
MIYDCRDNKLYQSNRMDSDKFLKFALRYKPRRWRRFNKTLWSIKKLMITSWEENDFLWIISSEDYNLQFGTRWIYFSCTELSKVTCLQTINGAGQLVAMYRIWSNWSSGKNMWPLATAILNVITAAPLNLTVRLWTQLTVWSHELGGKFVKRRHYKQPQYVFMFTTKSSPSAVRAKMYSFQHHATKRNGRILTHVSRYRGTAYETEESHECCSEYAANDRALNRTTPEWKSETSQLHQLAW